MEQDLSGSYEVVLPITLDPAEGPKTDGTVELGHDDAALFLSRGFVRKPGNPVPPATSTALSETPGVSATPATPPASQPGLDQLDAATREALASAGFDSDAKVRAAEDATLMSINGVGEATVRKIRAHLAV